MSHSLSWLRAQAITIAAGSSYILPSNLYLDGSDYEAIFAWLVFSAFSGGGTLTIRLQAAVYASTDSNAWVDINAGTVTADGDKIFMVGPSATNLLTGAVRLKIDCATATTSFVLRSEVLMKGQTGNEVIEWLPATSISVTAGTDVVLDADRWANVGRYVNAFALVEFEVASGTASNLTVAMQTAPALASETGAFVPVASTTMSATSKQIDGTLASTNPPMDVLRLSFSSSSGTIAGTIRVVLLLKDDN